MKTTALKNLAAGIAAIVLTFAPAMTGRAGIVIEPMGPPVMTGSWDLYLLAYGDPFNMITGTIISGGAFESPGMSANGWALTTDTPSVATITGPEATSLVFTAHFADSPPPPEAVPPFVVNFEVSNGENNPLAETSFEWNGSSLVIIPEPDTSTLLVGFLLLLPFGRSTLRMLRRKRAA